MSNNRFIVPYEGTYPYLVISYNYADRIGAMKTISRFQSDGLRVWFGAGLTPQSRLTDYVKTHINGCSYFIALEDEYESYYNIEFEYARKINKQRSIMSIEGGRAPSSAPGGSGIPTLHEPVSSVNPMGSGAPSSGDSFEEEYRRMFLKLSANPAFRQCFKKKFLFFEY